MLHVVMRMSTVLTSMELFLIVTALVTILISRCEDSAGNSGDNPIEEKSVELRIIIATYHALEFA